MLTCFAPSHLSPGEVLLGDLNRAGFSITEDHESSDAIIINTCAFVEDAKSESLEAIVEAASLNADGRDRQIIVTGCLAQRYGDSLAADLPEADLILGFQNYGQLADNLAERMGMPSSSSGASTSTATAVAAKGPSSRVQVGEATVPFRPEWDRVRLTPRHTAYLRVAEGCNHACTFCAIPGFRGKFRSKPWGQVLEEAQRLVDSGVVELNLIAEDTNQYGQDRRDGKGLAELLHQLSELEGLKWIRILYAYPSYFTEELIDEIATNPKVGGGRVAAGGATGQVGAAVQAPATSRTQDERKEGRGQGGRRCMVRLRMMWIGEQGWMEGCREDWMKGRLVGGQRKFIEGPGVRVHGKSGIVDRGGKVPGLSRWTGSSMQEQMRNLCSCLMQGLVVWWGSDGA